MAALIVINPLTLVGWHASNYLKAEKGMGMTAYNMLKILILAQGSRIPDNIMLIANEATKYLWVAHIIVYVYTRQLRMFDNYKH